MTIAQDNGPQPQDATLPKGKAKQGKHWHVEEEM